MFSSSLHVFKGSAPPRLAIFSWKFNSGMSVHPKGPSFHFGDGKEQLSKKSTVHLSITLSFHQQIGTNGFRTQRHLHTFHHILQSQSLRGTTPQMTPLGIQKQLFSAKPTTPSMTHTEVTAHAIFRLCGLLHTRNLSHRPQLRHHNLRLFRGASHRTCAITLLPTMAWSMAIVSWTSTYARMGL